MKAIGRYAAGSALGAVALRSLSEYASAQTTTTASPLVIPKLSYNPTIDNLFSDYDLQKQMLALDAALNSSSPPTAKALFGVDNNNFDFIFDYTTKTQLESDQLLVAVSTTTPSISPPDAFYARYIGNEPTGGSKIVSFNVYDPLSQSFVVQPLPQGFNWDAKFTKSYYNQNQDNMVFAAQIPNSYIGPGTGGQYGMTILGGVSDARFVPGYPPDASIGHPETYGLFAVQYPVPFSLSWQIIVGTISVPLLLATWQKHRIEGKRKVE